MYVYVYGYGVHCASPKRNERSKLASQLQRLQRGANILYDTDTCFLGCDCSFSSYID